MTATLPPDVADLLRAISDSLAPDGVIDRDGAAVVYGAVSAVLSGTAPQHATWVIRKYQLDPAAFWAPCGLHVCDCCQVRRATTTVGCVEMCPLCAEERAAEADKQYGSSGVRLLHTPIEQLTVDDDAEVTTAP